MSGAHDLEHARPRLAPAAQRAVLGVSPQQMGVLSAVPYAPYSIVGLLAGVWVDRLRRRPVLIAAVLGQLLACVWLLASPVRRVGGTEEIAPASAGP